LSELPPGLENGRAAPVPAGCVFWREALKAARFIPVPSDHYNCAVGAYTHSIALPAERGAQLEDTVKFMVMKEYLRMEEVAGIPTLEKAPAYIAYAPVDAAPFRPDLVLIAAKPSAAMLIYETALRSGAGPALANALGRRPAPCFAGEQDRRGVAVFRLHREPHLHRPAGRRTVRVHSRRPVVGVVSNLSVVGKANAEMQRRYREQQAHSRPRRIILCPNQSRGRHASGAVPADLAPAPEPTYAERARTLVHLGRVAVPVDAVEKSARAGRSAR